jgi:hypothetical protein
LSRPRRRDDTKFGRLYERLNQIVSDEVRRTLAHAER